MFAPVCRGGPRPSRGGPRQGRPGRCSHRPGVFAAAWGFGRGMPLPYMASGHDRPNGIAAATRANVGRDALIPPHPAAAQGSAGGMNPAPTGIFFVSGKPGVRGRAGRADIESAPTWGVCGGGNVPDFEPPRCGGRERPPYGPGETRRPTGKIQPPRPLQTNVGDDARTAPAGAFRRPTGPQVRLLGRRSSRGVRGGVGFGRGMPLPYMASGHDRPNGLAAAARANVGRDAPSRRTPRQGRVPRAG